MPPLCDIFHAFAPAYLERSPPHLAPQGQSAPSHSANAAITALASLSAKPVAHNTASITPAATGPVHSARIIQPRRGSTPPWRNSARAPTFSFPALPLRPCAR